MSNALLDSLRSQHTTLDEGVVMLVVTWNVGAQVERAENLRGLLFPHSQRQLLQEEPPGLVAVGLQEMVELSTSNVIGSTLGSESEERVSEWQALLLCTLQQRDARYTPV
ncbi:hypothetical protein B484DRAFT_85090, partial [Ochromonadaceae sp. CCMP2298]